MKIVPGSLATPCPLFEICRVIQNVWRKTPNNLYGRGRGYNTKSRSASKIDTSRAPSPRRDVRRDGRLPRPRHLRTRRDAAQSYAARRHQDPEGRVHTHEERQGGVPPRCVGPGCGPAGEHTTPGEGIFPPPRPTATNVWLGSGASCTTTSPLRATMFTRGYIRPPTISHSYRASPSCGTSCAEYCTAWWR